MSTESANQRPSVVDFQKAASSAFARTHQELLAVTGVDPELGLVTERIAALQSAYGRNQLTEMPPIPLWRKLLEQFKDLVIWILIVAAVISGALGEWVDALAIVAIVLLNAAIGFFQEERAGQALAALQKLSAPQAKVTRDGMLRSIPAIELIPGDVIEIEAGDNIPADVRLLRSFNLAVQEASLTGESVPVDKEADAAVSPTAPLGERRNMTYMGTVVAAGKARGLVVATGMQTELGHIAGMLQRNEPEPTPLQRRLEELGRLLIIVCLVIVGVIFGLQVLRGGKLIEAFLLAVSLAVAAVPEGLPAVVTIALALGLQRMVKRNALVRKLPSVETLGSVTVICSDKTGTLTRNEMTVREVVAGETHYHVTGSGYAPHGEFHQKSAATEIDPVTSVEAHRQPVDLSAHDDLRMALTIGAWCNNARLEPTGDGDQGWRILGDPTEGALIVLGRKAGIEVSHRGREVEYEIPFDSTRKAMSIVVRTDDGRRLLYCKGAPEVILEKAAFERVGAATLPLSPQRRREILQCNTEMADRALRVLALAYRYDPPDQRQGDPESQLVFSGLVGMIDPPRDEVRQAILQCRSAGIRPVMITGDHPATASAVARELGMVTANDRAMPGADLERLSDRELAEQVERIVVYARASAEHKLRIVQAWKSRGQIVAMTGDGVNDAPAVKAADIGIAMGITGTDVTKEASDMVLTDDNFASIVSAVEEGRGIFDNIQKVLQFLLSCNFGEILLMLVASLLGWPAPMLPIQLLWINLVTDGLPALALSLEPPEPGLMNRPPRRAGESILSRRLSVMIAVQGLLIALVGILAFGISLHHEPDRVDRARAMTFCVIVYAELFRALAARSSTLTLGQLGFWTNPQLLLAILVSALLQVGIAVFPFTQQVFDVPFHSLGEWSIIIGLAFTPVAAIETFKMIRQRLGHKFATTGVLP